jgi:hypothetical protein
MNAMLLAIAIMRSGRIDLIENVASTRADARYPMMSPRWDDSAHASA